MNDLTPTPDPCARVAAAVQALLDGDRTPLTADLDVHRAACAACRQQLLAAEALARGLALVPRPEVPAGFTPRILGAVLTDPELSLAAVRVSRRSVVVLAVLAAGLLLALGLSRPWSADSAVGSLLVARKAPAPPEMPRDRPPDVVPMSDHLATAGSAIASLTRRTTDQAIEPTRKLLPGPVAPPTLDVAAHFPQAIDPAAQSLQEVRQGAATGLEPMANSARRAFAMLRRELPGEPDRKRDP